MRRFCCLITLLACSFPTFAWGQQYGPMQNAQREQLRTNGVIKSLAPGKLFVVAEDGGQWVVIVEQQARDVGIAGSAEVGWLSPGMFVEFKAAFNARGETTAPVSAVTVMVPDMKNPPGTFSEVGGGKTANLFSTNEEAADTGKGKKKEETVDLRVVGRITRVKDGKALINAGNANLAVEFDDKARVSVELTGAASLALARPNDKVEIGGWYLQGQKGQLWANHVQVSAAQPFAPAESGKKKPLPPAATKTEKPAEKPAE